MASEFLYQLVGITFVVTFLMTANESYFAVSEVSFMKLFILNIIYIAAGAILIAASAVYLLESSIGRFLHISGDTISIIISLFISFLILFFIKYYIFRYFEIKFLRAYIVIAADLLLMGIFPLVAFIILKNFKHGR